MIWKQGVLFTLLVILGIDPAFSEEGEGGEKMATPMATPMTSHVTEQSYQKAFRPDDLNLERECQRMYKFREVDISYPVPPREVVKADVYGENNYCRIATGGQEYPVTTDQYYAYLHKSLRFICKGKRPILLDFAASISGCGGELRHVEIEQKDDKCFIHVVETDDYHEIPKHNLQELKVLMRDMSMMERVTLQMTSGLVYKAMEEAAKCNG